VKQWLIIFLAVLPFQLPLLQQLCFDQSATGFLQYDAPYYLANARAIFERGNGFAYPNPYDPDPNSPVIYFHWLIWLLGAGVKFLHLDPGMLYAAMGFIAAFVCGALTLKLVELTLPDPKGRKWWFLLTMWGGGIVFIAGAIGNLRAGRPLMEYPFGLDTGNGSWLSNWGRNIQFPTEAVYHGLVAAAWIAILQRRWLPAILTVVALAATHPFSGLQHLLILSAWFLFVALKDRTPAAWGRIGMVLIAGGLFAGYYFWFLNRFPAYRNLAALWSVPDPWYSVCGINLLVSIGPLAVLAICSLYCKHWRANEADKFWIIAFAITFLLMKHDWFIAPHQPAHFIHGYQWLPLWLIALPQLQSWTTLLFARVSRLKASLVCIFCCCLFISDNGAVIASELNGAERDVFSFAPGEREMFAWMNHAHLRGVLVCYDTRISYLTPVYTGVTPYYGHLNNTPNIRARWKNVSAWYRSGQTGPWLDSVDYLLIERSQPPAALDRSKWHELHGNPNFVLFAHERTAPR